MTYPVNFEYAFERLMGVEVGSDPNGGLVDDPRDAGGLTKWGVAQRYNPDIDVRNLTRDGAKDFYWQKYWRPMRLDLIANRRVAYEILENAVNSSPSFAVQCVQGALRLMGVMVARDGALGPQTAAAVNTFRDVDALLRLQNILQGMMLIMGYQNVDEVIVMIRERLKYSAPFIQGWMKRIEL